MDTIFVGMDFGMMPPMSASAIISREGSRLLYVLKEGETAKATERGFIVCHPDRPPKLIRSDGSEELIDAARK